MTLFWKIFVSFSLAMTLTLIGAVFVSFRLAEQVFDQDRFENRDQLIAAGAHALGERGEQGLREWLNDNHRLGRTALLIIKPDGEELLGRPVPGRWLRYIRETSLAPAGDPSNVRPRRLVPRLIGPDGSEYNLVFSRPPPTLFGVLDWPSTQVAVLLIAVAAAALTALILARYLSAPIVELQHATRSLAAGNLETRVGRPSDRRTDEVGALARDFDKMAEQIQALITAKETLLRDVSHELRSPMARIRVALALAERDAPAGTKTHLDRIEQETERLDQLVGQILLLTRLRTQTGRQFSSLRIDELIDEIVENARFEHPDVDLRYQPEGQGVILGNAAELRSAIENVVRNALSFAKPPGRVDISLREADGFVEVCVADNGPGVAAEHLDRIFEPFFRTDASRDHRHRGEGIGLAITARVMEHHDGSAEARNRSEGGLEIVLRLPRAPRG
jgi:two-component system, OmpR family, sensor kinase